VELSCKIIAHHTQIADIDRVKKANIHSTIFFMLEDIILRKTNILKMLRRESNRARQLK
jgi:hypothetical protein